MLEPTGFREIARSATVTYAIPFVFALCLALAVLTLGGAILSDPPLRWVMVGFAGVSTVFAFGLIAAVAIYRPALLRSERQELRHRVLDRIGDNKLSPKMIEAILHEPGAEKMSPATRRLARRNGNEQ